MTLFLDTRATVRTNVAALAVLVAIATPLGCPAPADTYTDDRSPMSMDAIDVCTTLEAASRCDTKRCIEIVCWQSVGPAATSCPSVINADYDAIAQVKDPLVGTYPVPNDCVGDEIPRWNIDTRVSDDEIWFSCPSWQGREGVEFYPALYAAEPLCNPPLELPRPLDDN